MENIVFEFISRYITLTEEEKIEFIKINSFRSYKKGTVILAEGESTDEYFLF